MISIQMMTKSDQRRDVKLRLSQMTLEQRTQATQMIHRRLIDFTSAARFDHVFIYASLPNEVGTDELIHHWLSNKKSVYLPRVQAQHQVSWHRISSFKDLVLGFKNIREPASHLPASMILAPALLLVPGLGFDRKGYRLGRGGGFYDRILESLPEGVLEIGLFFACQEFPRIVREEHDCQLSHIITENEQITPLEVELF